MHSGSVGRVLDLGLKGCESKSKTHRRNFIVSLSKKLSPLLSTGSMQEDRKVSRHDGIIVAWDVKHQHKLEYLDTSEHDQEIPHSLPRPNKNIPLFMVT